MDFTADGGVFLAPGDLQVRRRATFTAWVVPGVDHPGEEAELLLERANAALQRRNDELERLSYVISHDLRAPLRSIRSFGELFEEDCADELTDEGRAYLSKMVGAAERMGQLLEGVLAFSRLAASERFAEPVDLMPLVEGIVEDLAADIAEAEATIDLRALPTVKGLPIELHSLLHNLLGNAIKYRDPKRALEVTVGAEPVEAGWRIHVKDNGIGFDPTLAAQARQMFVQLHPRGEFQGVGLGLALCDKVLERHGSQLDITSVEGRGTEMSFVLAGAS